MNPEHLKILQQGVDAWNAWRRRNYIFDRKVGSIDMARPDLSGANLSGANLSGAVLPWWERGPLPNSGADLSNTNLVEANLSGADLTYARLDRAFLYRTHLFRASLRHATFYMAEFHEADLRGADLRGADLRAANFFSANLEGANLEGADLERASLSVANFRGANLAGAKLVFTSLIRTDLSNADLTGCRVYGISAWTLRLDGAKQRDLVITRYDEPEITVDNIEIAQFVYLLLHNEKIREIIDTITSKAVLILGRFTEGRKRVLDALREELRKHNYLPILFDFDKPAGRDITETVSLLARMARFVVADITDAKSIPQELGVIVPDLPSVPVQPLLLEGSSKYGMFEHFRRYPWVLKPYRYKTQEQLIANLGEKVIRPAEAKVLELRQH